MTLWMSKKQIDDFQNKTKPKAKKASKYGNEKTDGYDSKKEARRAKELKLLLAGGVITDLVEQPEFVLLPKQEGERGVKYIADFSYIENGETIVEDVKSAATRKKESYIIKRKLLLFIHNIKIKEV